MSIYIFKTKITKQILYINSIHGIEGKGDVVGGCRVVEPKKKNCTVYTERLLFMTISY